MTAYSDVFERKEMKYRITAAQLAELLPVLQEHLVPADFADATVRSLYYDTPGDDLIARSIEGPLYKEKLRLRVYGDGYDPAMPAFVEIKKKFKGIVYKRRVMLSLAAAEAFLDGMPYEEALAAYPLADKKLAAQVRENAAKNKQIANEIAFFMQRYAPLQPSILTACSRCSLVDPDGGDLRITIDTQLCAKHRPTNIGDVDGAGALIGEGDAIMEIKSTFALPLWLTSALSSVGAYKQSFSKCGAAYAQAMRTQNEERPMQNQKSPQSDHEYFFEVFKRSNRPLHILKKGA